MIITRRNFLAGSAAVAGLSAWAGRLPAAEGGAPDLRVGICDWSLGDKTPKALDLARTIHLDGVQISPDKPEDVLSYSRSEVQKAYKEKMKETGVAVSGLALTIGNQCPLATDLRSVKWMEQTIDATAELGARTILLAFFGKADLRAEAGGDDKDGDKKKGKKGKAKEAQGAAEATPTGIKKAEFDALVEKLKAVAPRAKDKGVLLGLENTLSAVQNIEIMDAVGSEAMAVYYDIANSTKGGYDVPAEIRLLKGRICEFHFKENQGNFPDGSITMGPIIEAVKAIGYKGWIVLERHFGADKMAYFDKNAQWIRRAFGLKTPA